MSEQPDPYPVPELWFSRTLAADIDSDGGLIERQGDEYCRERFAAPWWPIEELPPDAVRLVPEATTTMTSHDVLLVRLQAIRDTLRAFLATTDDTPRSSPELMQGVVERHAHALASLGSSQSPAEPTSDAGGHNHPPSAPAALSVAPGHQDDALMTERLIRWASAVFTLPLQAVREHAVHDSPTWRRMVATFDELYGVQSSAPACARALEPDVARANDPGERAWRQGGQADWQAHQ